MNIYEVANRMKSERKTIFDLKIRVTFYARVSTKREEQENSIENQIHYFSELIKNNENWTYVAGYIDRVRGESADNRANFMRMIEDGKAGVFDLVLTKEVSRFARNTIDSLTFTRELLLAGVGVFFQNDNICTIDTDSELRLTIMSSIAADEVRKLSERVHWGHKRSIENGNVLGNSRIFGYDKNDCRLVVNEPEAEMVRLIFELYSTGDYSVRKIENTLYEKGYRGRNGTRIHHNTISGIIQNMKYKGYYCGNKVRIVDYRTKEQLFLPKEEWVVYKDETGDIVPAIVSEEIWDKCNEIFNERSDAIKSRERSFKDKSVFTGKIWCKEDEMPYWRTSYSNSRSKGQPVYQWICSNKKKNGSSSCKSFSILEKDLYTMLSEHLREISVNIDEYIRVFLKSYKESEGQENLQKEIDAAKAALEKEKARREKLLDAFTEDLITKEEFKERNTKSTALIEQLESDIKALEEKKNGGNNLLKEIKKVESFFRKMYRSEGKMTKGQVDEMVKEIIDRIDIAAVDDRTMSLEIKLKTGLNSDFTYVRKGERYGRRYGQITKKMIESYENSAK